MLYEDVNGAIWYLSKKHRPKLLYSQAKILYKLTPSVWILEVEVKINNKIKDRTRIYKNDRHTHGENSFLYDLAEDIDYDNLVFSKKVGSKYIFIFRNENKYTLWIYDDDNEGDCMNNYKDTLTAHTLYVPYDFVFAQIYDRDRKLLAITPDRKIHISIDNEFKILKEYKRNPDKIYVQLCNGAYWYYKDDPAIIFLHTPYKSSNPYKIARSEKMAYLDFHNGYIHARYFEDKLNGKILNNVPIVTSTSFLNIKSARNV